MEPGYAEALWKAHPHMNESADFVMYWWDRAAELLTRKKTPLRRFGLVTTNSISQVFQRRVMERHLNAKAPVSIIFAVPDHPWTKATKDSAAVRIAMTVARAGEHHGDVRQVLLESGLNTDEPTLEFASRIGRVNADLTVGLDLTSAQSLMSTAGLGYRGVTFMGDGFILTQKEAAQLVESGRDTVAARPLLSGKDLSSRPRNVTAIDFFGLTEAEARQRHPILFQRLLERVKPERERKASTSDTSDSRQYAKLWWLFAKPRPELRGALEGLGRQFVTVQTSKHRIFQCLPSNALVDQTVVVVAVEDTALLAALSSTPHKLWALSTGGTLEDRPRYSTTGSFETFPFPDPDEATRARLRALGEELDATRKAVQAEHPDLTLTGLYNVLEKVRAGEALSDKDQDVKDRGRVLILKDLHDQIDRATMHAYGWDDLIPLLSSSSGKPRVAAQTGGPSGAREREPAADSARSDSLAEKVAFGAAGSPGRFAPEDDESKGLDEIILERLVALNAERAAEEAAGHVRWLRPDYQIPRFAKGAAAAKSGELDLQDNVVALDKGLPAFPKDKGEQVMAIRAVLQASGRPMDAAEVSRAFRRGGKTIRQRVAQAMNTLVRYGELTALPDGTFVARRAA